MSESLMAVLFAVVFIGGPFFVLWLIDRRKQMKGELSAKPAKRRILHLLIIMAVGIVVIIGVFYACTWVVVAQPTIGKFNVATAIAVVVIVGFSILIILQYVGLLAGMISFISRCISRIIKRS